ncbi:YceD family protein [Alkalilimnicola ehrlichii]|uniref:YceD family protein n=1 Tax=Alkalilimnicola ehrlichii TaxID=351052 RepID=UPI003B9FD37D
MSSSPLPEYLVHDMFTEAGTRLEGRLPRAAMARLSAEAVVADQAARVRVALRAFRDDQGRQRLSGAVSASITLRCQRCLQPYEQALDAEVALQLVASEHEAESLAPEFDPLVMATGKLPLVAVVEDELLLAMPAIARHPEGGCATPDNPAEPQDEPDERAKNPFAVLERMKCPSDTDQDDT